MDDDDLGLLFLNKTIDQYDDLVGPHVWELTNTLGDTKEFSVAISCPSSVAPTLEPYICNHFRLESDECFYQQDVVIALDASSVLTTEQYETVRDALAASIHYLVPPNSNLAIVQTGQKLASEGTIVKNLNEDFPETEWVSTIQGMTQEFGVADEIAALQFVIDDVLSHSTYTHKHLIIISDGESPLEFTKNSTDCNLIGDLLDEDVSVNIFSHGPGNEFQWAYERDIVGQCDWSYRDFNQVQFFPDYATLNFNESLPVERECTQKSTPFDGGYSRINNTNNFVDFRGYTITLKNGKWVAENETVSSLTSNQTVSSDYPLDGFEWILRESNRDLANYHVSINCSEVEGCDGVTNSGKELDVCLYCGGDGTGCNRCDKLIERAVAECEDEVDDSKADISALNTILSQSALEVVSLEEKLNSCEEDADALTAQVTSLSNEVASLTNQVSNCGSGTTTTSAPPLRYEPSQCESGGWLYGKVTEGLSNVKLCVVTSQFNGVQEWVVEDNGILYPTCVAYSEDSEGACDSTDLLCARDTTYGFRGNQESAIELALTRSDYKHPQCPHMQDTCREWGNYWKEQLVNSGIREETADQMCFDNEGGLHIVTRDDGPMPICVGFSDDPKQHCPSVRSYICGTMVDNGYPAFGWPGSILRLVVTALQNPAEGFKHPSCPF